jgi:hypothetical protein
MQKDPVVRIDLLPAELIDEIFKYSTWKRIVRCKITSRNMETALSHLDMVGSGHNNRNILTRPFSMMQ